MVTNATKKELADALAHCFKGARFKMPRSQAEFTILKKAHMLYITPSAKLPKCTIGKCNCYARYDVQVPSGSWEFICHAHTKVLNSRLGLGYGQAMLTKAEYAKSI